jgi:hypothetical protein
MQKYMNHPILRNKHTLLDMACHIQISGDPACEHIQNGAKSGLTWNEKAYESFFPYDYSFNGFL